MPRTPHLTKQYADALRVLTVAAGRPATVIGSVNDYCIRVDFEFSRYLLATNTAVGLYDSEAAALDEDSQEPWRVQVLASHSDGDRLLADRSAPWLIDAYDAAHLELKDLQPPLLSAPVPTV